MPNTVEAVILPGWMEQDKAIQCLTNECVFDEPLSREDAERIWKEHRERAEALPEREIAPPTRLPLNPAEHSHAHRFMAFMRQVGAADIQEVIKIDPMQLLVRQYHIVIERSQGYALKFSSHTAWMEACLPTSLTQPPITVTMNQNNFDTSADFDLPHAEFTFGPLPNGTFAPIQFLRHVTVMNAGQGMLLWAGYHRTYARVLSTTPTAAERSALVALTSNTLRPPPNNATGVTPKNSLDLFGRRPALFADFFTDGFFMNVRLRKKRFQLQVRSKLVALDDST